MLQADGLRPSHRVSIPSRAHASPLPAMATLMGTYDSIVEFIDATASHISEAERIDVVKDQHNHLVSTIVHLRLVQADATALINRMKQADCPFDADQVHNIITLTMGKVKGNTIAVKQPSFQVTMQTHLYLYNYINAPFWSIFQATGETMKHRIQHMVDLFLVVLGLPNPDAITKKHAVTILHVASDTDPSPQEAYDDVRMLTDVLTMKRARSKPAQPYTTFPADVEEQTRS